MFILLAYNLAAEMSALSKDGRIQIPNSCGSRTS